MPFTGENIRLNKILHEHDYCKHSKNINKGNGSTVEGKEPRRWRGTTDGSVERTRYKVLVGKKTCGKKQTIDFKEIRRKKESGVMLQHDGR
jgi:hypothetical protein